MRFGKRFKASLQFRIEYSRQGECAVLFPFAVMDREHTEVEVDVLDSEIEAFG